MFPFAFPFQLAVAFNSIPGGLEVIDARYVMVKHAETLVKIGNRRIKEIAIDRGGGKRMETIFGGSVADGDLMMITSEPMYIAADFDPTNLDDEKRYQTFFVYEDQHYRIAGVDKWRKQIGVNVYLAKLHVPQQMMEGADVDE